MSHLMVPEEMTANLKVYYKAALNPNAKFYVAGGRLLNKSGARMPVMTMVGVARFRNGYPFVFVGFSLLPQTG